MYYMDFEGFVDPKKTMIMDKKLIKKQNLIFLFIFLVLKIFLKKIKI
jgi:hypothetical protein